MGWARPICFFREKGWAKREFHNDWGAITEFSSKFIVDEKLVKNYIEHLAQLPSANEIRKQERRKEKQVRALLKRCTLL